MSIVITYFIIEMNLFQFFSIMCDKVLGYFASVLVNIICLEANWAYIVAFAILEFLFPVFRLFVLAFVDMLFEIVAPLDLNEAVRAVI